MKKKTSIPASSSYQPLSFTKANLIFAFCLSDPITSCEICSIVLEIKCPNWQNFQRLTLKNQPPSVHFNINFRKFLDPVLSDKILTSGQGCLDCLGVKLIHLIRDPRAVELSRRNMPHSAQRGILGTDRVCDRVWQDVQES